MPVVTITVNYDFNQYCSNILVTRHYYFILIPNNVLGDD